MVSCKFLAIIYKVILSFPSLLSFLLFICCCFQLPVKAATVTLGVEQLFNPEYQNVLKGKKIGLITNHTAVNSKLETTVEVFRKNAPLYGYTLKAFFAPEHGLTGNQYAAESVKNSHDPTGIPIYSLHGETRRPTKEMLQDINLLVYDIQDIGSRSYTYISTLFYCMEEAAKYHIPVVVLDRPNPINGIMVDGPLLEERWRSIVGYINVPYCHGMTIGELASYFKAEYKIACSLVVIPMKGWKREMSFADTELRWIPTSPQIPEASTAMYYPLTGLLGELQLVNIGVGYTLPFKLVGAPWINGQQLAKCLNAQQYPGVQFYPFSYRPFFGRFAHEDCQGVMIHVTNHLTFLPVTTQYLIIGVLKSLYPNNFQKVFQIPADRREMFHKVNGTADIYEILVKEKYAAWRLKSFHQQERAVFLNKRTKYLLYPI